jgi:hypothetical protein
LRFRGRGFGDAGVCGASRARHAVARLVTWSQFDLATASMGPSVRRRRTNATSPSHHGRRGGPSTTGAWGRAESGPGNRPPMAERALKYKVEGVLFSAVAGVAHGVLLSSTPDATRDRAGERDVRRAVEFLRDVKRRRLTWRHDRDRRRLQPLPPPRR